MAQLSPACPNFFFGSNTFRPKAFGHGLFLDQNFFGLNFVLTLDLNPSLASWHFAALQFTLLLLFSRANLKRHLMSFKDYLHRNVSDIFKFGFKEIFAIFLYLLEKFKKLHIDRETARGCHPFSLIDKN